MEELTLPEDVRGTITDRLVQMDIEMIKEGLQYGDTVYLDHICRGTVRPYSDFSDQKLIDEFCEQMLIDTRETFYSVYDHDLRTYPWYATYRRSRQQAVEDAWDWVYDHLHCDESRKDLKDLPDEEKEKFLETNFKLEVREHQGELNRSKEDYAPL